MRSDWMKKDSMAIVLACMVPENALAMEVALHTGLRIGDVLAVRTAALKKRMYVREAKTNKSRQVYLPDDLLRRLQENAGKVFVFEGRDPSKHRTRQAVWHDMHRVAKFLRPAGVVGRGQTVTPHSARKMYAVDVMEKTGDIKAVGRALNHDAKHPDVTLLYALADHISAKKKRGGAGG